MLYFGFQKLGIYQLSKELVKDIYKLSSFFPPDEKYALVQQINKAAVPVASNIAEMMRLKIFRKRQKNYR